MVSQTGTGTVSLFCGQSDRYRYCFTFLWSVRLVLVLFHFSVVRPVQVVFHFSVVSQTGAGTVSLFCGQSDRYRYSFTFLWSVRPVLVLFHFSVVSQTGTGTLSLFCGQSDRYRYCFTFLWSVRLVQVLFHGQVCYHPKEREIRTRLGYFQELLCGTELKFELT